MTQFAAAFGSTLTRGFAGRALVGAVAAAAAVSLAAPANAGVILNTATPQDMAQFGTTTPTLGGLTPDRSIFGMSPYLINVTENGRNFNALAFCVQFYVDMPWNYDEVLGLNVVNGAYHEGDFLTLENTSEEVRTKVFNLIEHGSDLWLGGNTPNLNSQLAAVQGAIWQVMTGKTIVFSEYGATNEDSNYLIQDFVTLASTPRVSPIAVRTLISDNDEMQAIAFAVRTAAVPEPSAWALMLVGFFTVGASVRAARRRTSAAL